MPCGSVPTLMCLLTRASMSDRATRAVPPPGSCGLLDTSVVIDLDVIDSEGLPDTTAISAITFAELAAGPHATSDDDERGRRQDRLQWAGSIWNPLPCDGDVARAYGRIYATLKGTGRSSRRRFADLLIAATALAHELPLYTRNPGDFTGLEGLIDINTV